MSKHRVKKLLIAAALVAAATELSGPIRPALASTTTYYVSSSGNDANNGLSPQSAWKTIAHTNAIHLVGGDTVLFQGGSTFTGQLYFGPGQGGSSTSPVVVSSYGTGPATINAGNTNALYVYDAGGFQISDLNLVGSGASTSKGSGISFYNDLSGTTVLDYVNISEVVASGFLNGFLLGGGNGASGYSNVTVASSVFHDNELSGLDTYGPTFNASAPAYANRGVYVTRVTAYNNQGNAALRTADSGSGIVLGSSQNARIEDSSAYNNGGKCVATACGVGIWTYDSDSVTIDDNISYNNHTGSKVDGDGFDLDQNTSDSTLQDNYSYGNDGAGYLLYALSTDSAHRDNTVSFNISQNDGRKNSFGALFLYGPVAGDALYDNTVYISPSAQGGTPTDIKVVSLGAGTASVRNNIFYASGGLYPVVVTTTPSASSLSMQQNDYFNFTAYWGTSTYTTLAAWRTASGEETLNGAATGLTANPQLADAGGGGALTNPANLSQLTAYEPAAGSPVTSTGLNLRLLFATDVGSQDFFGAAVPGPTGFAIGAAE